MEVTCELGDGLSGWLSHWGTQMQTAWEDSRQGPGKRESPHLSRRLTTDERYLPHAVRCSWLRHTNEVVQRLNTLKVTYRKSKMVWNSANQLPRSILQACCGLIGSGQLRSHTKAVYPSPGFHVRELLCLQLKRVLARRDQERCKTAQGTLYPGLPCRMPYPPRRSVNGSFRSRESCVRWM